ncbi:MAG: hypothetical protein UZ11_BCD004001739 [Bacteroidetes bacterium OLB11]|nr:MAG: hypothetical protein UZ11_BCD004001739 [Bacteroidetes bacterium OLB11]
MRISQVDKDTQLFFVGAFLFSILFVLSFLFDFPILISIPFLILGLSFFLKDVKYAFYTMLFFIPLSFQYLDKYDFPDEPLMLLNTGFLFSFLSF